VNGIESSHEIDAERRNREGSETRLGSMTGTETGSGIEQRVKIARRTGRRGATETGGRRGQMQLRRAGTPLQQEIGIGNGVRTGTGMAGIALGCGTPNATAGQRSRTGTQMVSINQEVMGIRHERAT
jgi:hypothetical protein